MEVETIHGQIVAKANHYLSGVPKIVAPMLFCQTIRGGCKQRVTQ